MFFLIGAMEARLCPLRPGWCKSDSSLPQAIHATATFPVAAAGSDLDPLAFEPHPDHSGPIRVTGRRGKRYESFCTNILFRNSNIANKRDKKNSFVWDTDLGTGYVGHKLKCKFNMDFFERREWIFWTAPIYSPTLISWISISALWLQSDKFGIWSVAYRVVTWLSTEASL